MSKTEWVCLNIPAEDAEQSEIMQVQDDKIKMLIAVTEFTLRLYAWVNLDALITSFEFHLLHHMDNHILGSSA